MYTSFCIAKGSSAKCTWRICLVVSSNQADDTPGRVEWVGRSEFAERTALLLASPEDAALVSNFLKSAYS